MQHTSVAKCSFHGQCRWAHVGCISGDESPSSSRHSSPPPSPPPSSLSSAGGQFRPVSPEPAEPSLALPRQTSKGSLAPMILELPSAQKRGAAAKRGRAESSGVPVLSVREAQLGERTGAAARLLLAACLAGKCGGTGTHLCCSGCSTQVHAACAGAVEKEVDSSSFRCPRCHCQELSPGKSWEQASESLRSLVLVLCLQSVITVRGTTVTQWRQLRTLIASAEEDLGLPCLTSSAMRLKAFLCWLLTRGYAASIDTYVRGLSSMLGSPASDWLKSPLLIGVINRAHREHGEDHRSAACFPVNLVLHALKDLEPPPDPDPSPSPDGWGEKAAHCLLLAAVLAARFVLGLRPGETGESTGAHHLTAPQVVLGKHARLGDFVEAVLEHCKTANQRCKVTGAGVTASGIRLALHLLRYSMAAGFARVSSTTEGNPGFSFDAYVVRLSLQEHTDTQVTRAASLLPLAGGGGEDFLTRMAQRRRVSIHPELRYVNVARGTRQDCVAYAAVLQAVGMQPRVVDSPFFLRLEAGDFTAMPMDAAWASRHLRTRLDALAATLNIQLDGDPTGHGARRGATQAAKARVAAGISGATAEDIDLHFRWRLRELLKKMQVHYSGTRPLEQRLEVTRHI
jgi:hypothetical protein